MATYKKRGYKPKTKAEKDIELEDGSTTAEVFNTLDQTASKTEAWVEKNQKIIFGVIGAVAIAVLGYILYQKFIQEPNQAEAVNEVYLANSYYEQAVNATTAKDSLYNLALNGNAGKYGLLDIVDKYGGTPTGNIARYQAGMAYLNTNKYQEAINYLDEFKTDDPILGPLAKGGIADAFVQLNQPEEAYKYYKEAVSLSDNEMTTPRFLLKAGVTALQLEKANEAYDFFTRILDEYKEAPEATKAKIYQGQAEAMK
ncbi:MAG: tetratricopeptide repeat protein [Flavobacteriaceae bacterium]